MGFNLNLNVGLKFLVFDFRRRRKKKNELFIYVWEFKNRGIIDYFSKIVFRKIVSVLERFICFKIVMIELRL